MSHPSYKRLVEQMWNDKRITPEKLGALVKLQEQFSISDALASEIECTVMGMTKEEALVAGLGFGAVTPVPPTPAQAPTTSPLAEIGQPTVSGAKTTTGQERSNRSATPAPNFLIRGRYKVLETLGSGGMGKVFKVLDTRLGEVRALKVLAQDHINRPDLLERMRREVRLCQRLRHPGIVQVFDYDEDAESGLAFFTMEFVEGSTLRQWLSGRRGSLVPLAQAAQITDRLIAALEYAHSQGIVHLDLKPENIMFTGALDHIRILDFGISRALDKQGIQQSMLHGAGTPYYMAPEQEQGSPEVGPAADVYSLGAVLYELLTGSPPRGNFLHPHELRPEVPKDWSLAVMAAMRPKPGERPALSQLRRKQAADQTVPATTQPIPPPLPPVPAAPEELASKKLRDEYENTAYQNRMSWLQEMAPKHLPSWRKDAKAGDAFCQHLVASCLATGLGCDVDLVGAFRWYQEAAEQGFADSAFELGKCLLNGRGTENNEASALTWFGRAADKSHPEAMYFVGWMHDVGKGTRQNSLEAIRWYRKAAELGQVMAQRSLGICHFRGRGTPEDKATATRWFHTAAENGDAAAQTLLADCLYEGTGTPQDQNAAIRWYEKAANQGHIDAQYSMGFCLSEGHGVEKNITQGLEWMKKAAKQGHEKAGKKIASLEEELQYAQNKNDPALGRLRTLLQPIDSRMKSGLYFLPGALLFFALLIYIPWQWHQIGWRASGWALGALTAGTILIAPFIELTESILMRKNLRKAAFVMESGGFSTFPDHWEKRKDQALFLKGNSKAFESLLSCEFNPNNISSAGALWKTLIFLGLTTWLALKMSN